MNALLALGRRDLLLARSYRTAFVFDLGWGVVNVLIYYFISKVFAGTGNLGRAPSYFAFALAGILMSLVISSTASEIASKVREEQVTGTLEMLLAQPVRSAEIAFGTAVFPSAYAVVRVALYLGLAVAFLDLSTGQTDWFGVTVMLVLAAVAFAAVGIAAAAAVLVFKKAAVVDVAVFAMTFVSGALFPLSVSRPGCDRSVGSCPPNRRSPVSVQRSSAGRGERTPPCSPASRQRGSPSPSGSSVSHCATRRVAGRSPSTDSQDRSSRPGSATALRARLA